MFEGIFEALKINFPLNFTLNKLKVFQIMCAGTKNAKIYILGGLGGYLKNKILTIFFKI